MRKQFCDRCLTDITDKTSAAVNGVADADAVGNGSITLRAELCGPCYRELAAWLSTRVPAARKGTTKR